MSEITNQSQVLSWGTLLVMTSQHSMQAALRLECTHKIRSLSTCPSSSDSEWLVNTLFSLRRGPGICFSFIQSPTMYVEHCEADRTKVQKPMALISSDRKYCEE